MPPRGRSAVLTELPRLAWRNRIVGTPLTRGDEARVKSIADIGALTERQSARSLLLFGAGNEKRIRIRKYGAREEVKPERSSKKNANQAETDAAPTEDETLTKYTRTLYVAVCGLS